MEIPGPGVEWELQLRPTPQPWQHQIQATSVAYAAACGNAESLTHWARPEIEPASSQRQCRFLNVPSHSGNSSTESLPSETLYGQPETRSTQTRKEILRNTVPGVAKLTQYKANTRSLT